MNNEAEIAKLVGVMAAAFPNAKVSDPTVEAYISMLKDLPLDVLTAAVEQCILESEFFPTVAKLREKVAVLTTPQRPTPTEAFGELQGAIARTGFYRSPSFDDPIIARCVEALGWQHLCTSENLVADRARFIQMYEQLVERERESAKLGPKARAIRAITDGEVKEIGDGRGY